MDRESGEEKESERTKAKHFRNERQTFESGNDEVGKGGEEKEGGGNGERTDEWKNQGSENGGGEGGRDSGGVGEAKGKGGGNSGHSGTVTGVSRGGGPGSGGGGGKVGIGAQKNAAKKRRGEKEGKESELAPLEAPPSAELAVTASATAAAAAGKSERTDGGIGEETMRAVDVKASAKGGKTTGKERANVAVSAGSAGKGVKDGAGKGATEIEDGGEKMNASAMDRNGEEGGMKKATSSGPSSNGESSASRIFQGSNPLKGGRGVGNGVGDGAIMGDTLAAKARGKIGAGETEDDEEEEEEEGRKQRAELKHKKTSQRARLKRLGIRIWEGKRGKIAIYV